MKKPILYIIHGWTYTVAPWEKTLALLEKQGLKVEMLHVPGLTTPSRKVWTIEEYVKWADQNIPDGAVALGHSNGGRILLNLCAEKPQKLKHLILLDAAGVYENSGKRDVSRTLSKKFGFLKKIPGLAKIWHKITGASDYARAPENMKQTLTNMLDSDKRLILGKVTTPTSIIWGAADTITPPHQAKIMHEQIPNSTLEIHRGWSHAPYISHPTELAKAIWRAYRKPPEVKPKPEVTQAAERSASMSLRKAAEPVLPNPAEMSASMAFKKAAGPSGADIAKQSAALGVVGANRKTTDGVVANLKGVEYEKANLDTGRYREVISSASVPKISQFEKMKRSIKRKRNAKKVNQARKKATKVANKTARASQAKPSGRQSAKQSTRASKKKAKQ